MKAIVFDLGKVLIDYDHRRAMSGIAAVSQASLEEVLALVAAVGDQLVVGAMSAEELHRYLQAKAGTTSDFDAFLSGFAEGMERDEEAIAYALELAARPNVTVGVISNTNEAHVRWMDVNLPELDQFAVVMKSSEVLMAKPDPVLYRLTLELLDVKPEDALFIDDVQTNVDGATAVGMAAILHTHWATTRPVLEEWLCR